MIHLATSNSLSFTVQYNDHLIIHHMTSYTTSQVITQGNTVRRRSNHRTVHHTVFNCFKNTSPSFFTEAFAFPLSLFTPQCCTVPHDTRYRTIHCTAIHSNTRNTTSWYFIVTFTFSLSSTKQRKNIRMLHPPRSCPPHVWQDKISTNFPTAVT